MIFFYVQEDSLQPQAILMYVERCNIYSEISVLCSNLYTLTTLDTELENQENGDGKATSVQSIQSGCISLPRVISYLYNCQDELQPCNYTFLSNIYYYYRNKLFFRYIYIYRYIYN